MKKLYFLICFIGLISCIHAGSITLHTKSATVWLPQQVIKGNVSGIDVKNVTVHLNDSTFSVPVNMQNQFIIAILLKQKNNTVWVEAINKQNHISSDTILFKLGYKPLPLIIPVATVKNSKIYLHADIKNNPYNLLLSFFWSDDERNPATVKIINHDNGKTDFLLPLKKGDYYFNLTVKAGKDSVKFQTLVTRAGSIHCFNIQTDHAAWIDNAILYEITPHIFTENASYDDITAKLPEINKLGINCIWLQPVYASKYGHQAYDVTDYFSLRTDLGTEKQLQHLIKTAKNLHIKVLFDFVPNHTSVFHAYAQDVIAYGSNSHYYNFYQHVNDGAKYSSLYKKDSLGFYHYFWKELININFNNKEAQQWIIEACKYWLKKFDLDGYRFDAIWGLNARNDLFGKQLQAELKSIKPDILLLAEDKGENEKVYTEGYDAAYDWRTDTNWISHWSWQYNYDTKKSLTIFNFPDENKRGKKLRTALFSGDTQHLRLRFMENNDLPRFITDHGLARTKMVAALMFALPGIPLLYCGQEIGCTNKLYSSKTVFKSGQTIQSLDKDSFFNYYKQLIKLREENESLRSANMCDLPVNAAGSVVALHRWKNDEHFVVVINMSEHDQPVNVEISKLNTYKKDTILFKDLISGECYSSSGRNLKLTVQGYSTKLLLLSKERFVTDK